jgi:hypothetical protein
MKKEDMKRIPHVFVHGVPTKEQSLMATGSGPKAKKSQRGQGRPAAGVFMSGSACTRAGPMYKFATKRMVIPNVLAKENRGELAR